MTGTFALYLFVHCKTRAIIAFMGHYVFFPFFSKIKVSLSVKNGLFLTFFQ